MPLEILVPLIAIGLVVIIATVHLLGGSARLPVLTADGARQQFQSEVPDFEPKRTVWDSADRGLLLIQERGQPAGLVWAHGSKYVTRVLDGNSLRSLTLADPELTISLRELTLRNVTFLIDEECDFVAAQEALESLLDSSNERS